jgi:hypothetical protein
VTEPTAEDIAVDLAPRSPEECAARGILHSSQDDHSTAILDTDPEWLLLGMLGAAARKNLKQC